LEQWAQLFYVGAAMTVRPQVASSCSFGPNSNRLSVRLFGNLAVAWKGDVLLISRAPKIEALFAYLLLHQGRPIAREAIAQTMWPDDDTETAKGHLRRHIYRLLHALPKAEGRKTWLRISKFEIEWDGESDAWIDVMAFEQFSRAAETLPQAIELYRGDLLPHCYEDFIVPDRERLRELQSRNLESLILRHRRARDYPRAIEMLNALLRHDPWREDGLRQLMACKSEMGDRASALSEYERFAGRLRNEFGVEPMPETRAAFEAVRDNTLAAAAVASEEPPRETARAADAFPFVGRDADLQFLQDAWENAAGGNGSSLIVIGEAGIGKSRLLHELTLTSEARGGFTLYGETSAMQSPPYQAFVQALRFAIPVIESSGLSLEALGALGRLLPEVGARFPSIPPPAPLPIDQERSRLFQSVSETLRVLALRRPLLFLVEDLHWAGADTLELFAYLARRISDTRVFIVATCREEYVSPGQPLHHLVRDSQRARTLSLRTLARLDERAVVAIVAAALPGATGLSNLAKWFMRHSEGNPLLLCESIKQHLESGSAPLPVNARIEQTLSLRIDRLGSQTRTLAENAAVAGAAFDVDILRMMTGWPEREISDALSELLEHQIIRETVREPELDYAFSHHLIQNQIYDRMADRRRTQRHATAGRALEILYADRLENVAGSIGMHYERAGMIPRAAPFYVQAADSASKLLAHVGAIELYRKALTCSSDDSDAIEQRLSVELGNAGLIEDACRVLERITARRRARGEKRQEANYSLLLGAHYWDLLDAKRSFLWRKRALAAMKFFEGDALYYRASISVARAYALSGDALKALGYIPSAQRVAALGDAKLAADRYDTLGMARALQGRVRQAIRSYRKAVDASDAATDLYTAVRCRMSLGANAMCLGELQIAREASQDAARLARKRSMTLTELMILGNQAFIQLLGGTIGRARAYFNAVNDRKSDTDTTYLASSLAVMAILIGVRSDDRDLIDRHLPGSALQTALESGQPQLIGDLACALAEFYVADGKPAAARDLLRDVVPGIHSAGDLPWLMIAVANWGDEKTQRIARPLLAQWASPREHRVGRAYLNLFDALIDPQKKGSLELADLAGASFAQCGIRHFEAIALERGGKLEAALAIYRRMGNTREWRRLSPGGR
jgi:DNA-binding SARP family transcriptional activator